MAALLEQQGLNPGYLTHLARLPTAPVIGATPRQINAIAQTQINTQQLIDSSRAARRAIHTEMSSASSANPYVADKTLDCWLVDLSNLQGLDPSPPIEVEPRVINRDTPIRIRMLKSLGLNHYDSYVTHVTPSLTPSLYSTIKDPIKIPRTKGKLRGWLESMRSAYAMCFPDIFKCLVQPDPVNNLNTQSHFQYLADNSTNSEAAKFLDREITIYNYSSSILAKAIKQVLVAENDIYT